MMVGSRGLQSWSRLGLKLKPDKRSTFEASQYHIEEVDTHPNLANVAKKHMAHRDVWRSKYSPSHHTIEAFEMSKKFVYDFNDFDDAGGLPVILDSGCGTGRSSALLAARFPHIPVIGLDKSAARIMKSNHWSESNEEKPDVDLPNLLLLRCDVIDFWLLAATTLTSGSKPVWDVKLHTILYPNPYPKSGHLQRRWHGHPIFPFLLQLGADELRLRASWRTYLDEFAQAVEVAAEFTSREVDGPSDAGTTALSASCERYLPFAQKGPTQLSVPGFGDGFTGCSGNMEHDEYLTNFEAKYFKSQPQQPTYELRLGKLGGVPMHSP